MNLVIASGSLVDASGYKFTEKDTKPGKMKVKKTSKASNKKKADGMLLAIWDWTGLGAWDRS